ETGCPSAAHTLLKFTPAAITRTITSKAPGSGTSISSIWKASFGSPSRSWRITQAVIVAGSSPGSTSGWLIVFTSACAKGIPPVAGSERPNGIRASYLAGFGSGRCADRRRCVNALLAQQHERDHDTGGGHGGGEPERC